MPTRLKVYGFPMEGSCPSSYGPAKPCFYSAHTFVGNLRAAGGLNKVIVRMGRRNVQLAVKEILKPSEKGITMCIQPLYYYTQWQNVLLYIEAWRAHGATRFIVFYHSANRATRRVLEYYRELGVIEIRSWPSFGSLPAEIAENYPKIDDSSFIFAHFLSNNICVLDIRTTIGALADFDEVMVPRNGTLLEYATREMEGTNVGALSFGNNYVSMEPSIYTNRFSGLSSLTFYSKAGPSKFIFNSSVIDLCQIHWVQSFIDKTKKSKSANGALLHLRFNVKEYKAKEVKKAFRFFPNNTTVHIQNMENTTRHIFGESPPAVSLRPLEVLNSCVSRITKKGKTCRSTGGMCKADMDTVDDWIYDKTDGIFVSESSS